MSRVSEAHEEIRNLLGRYCELIDAGDFEGLGDLFADAALADEGGHELARGRAGVRQFYAGTRRYDGSPRTRHLTTNTIIDVDPAGDDAVARSAFVVFQATPELPLQPIVTGHYRDRFARRPDRTWAFAERRFAVDLTGDLTQHLS